MSTGTHLVTGGAGFIGSHLAEALLAQGARVRVFDNLSTGRQCNLDAFRGCAEVVVGDVRDLAAVRAAVEGVEVIFHLAASASVPFSVADPLTSLQVNVVGTQHILLAARDAGVRRVVFASSCAVYGDTSKLPLSEDLCPEPQSPYALHKLTGEHLCQLFTSLYGLQTVALRYFNVFGPRQAAVSADAGVIPRFLDALVSRRRPAVFGDGGQTRDFVYVADAVRASLLASTAPRAVGTVINVGSGVGISLLTLLRLAAELLDVPLEPECQRPRPGDIRDSLADLSRARYLLGYEPKVAFHEGLALALEGARRATVRT